jgi:uncharacterized phage infection (PIP) family protein YhgE
MKGLKKLADEIVSELVDCGAADEEPVEQYKKWTLQRLEKSFRALEQEVQKNLDGALAWQQRAEAAEADNRKLLKTIYEEKGVALRIVDKLNAVEAKLAELEKQCDALAAENAVLKHRAEYFMYGPDCGFERYDSQDAAIKAANEMIDDYREDAADGWCDEVEQVCFGVVLSYARQHDVQPPSEDNGYLGSVNYMMSAPETQATAAYLNAVRAEGIQMLLNKYAPHTIASSEASEFAAKLRAGEPS